MSADDDRARDEARLAQLLQERAARREQRAFARGQAAARLDALATDSVYVDGMRALAWQRAGTTGIGFADDAFLGIPDGWPEGVDGDEVVAESIEGHKTALLAEDEPTAGAGSEGPVSPTVQRLRARIGGGS